MSNNLKLVFAILLLTASYMLWSSSVRSAPKTRGWKIAERIEWNQSCERNILDEIKGQKQEADFKKVRAFCDCISGTIQYEMTPEEYYKNDQSPSDLFKRRMSVTFTTCLKGPT